MRSAANGRITPLLWAHQIKTPIAAMRLLLQEEDTERSRELGAELFRIEQYVEMDLNYARLNSHSTDFIIRSCPLDDIVRQALRKYAPLFVRQKLSLSWEPTGHTVLTDEKWLVFVLEQLLSNALKYTPSGTISLYVEDPLTLVIEDTGIGIAAEDLPASARRGSPAITEGRTRRPPDWGCTCAAVFSTSCPTRFPSNLCRERHPGARWAGSAGQPSE